MDIFFGNLFWGILIILIGLSIILKGFGVKIPLVSTFVAIIIILFGFKILFGSYRRSHGPRITAKQSGSTHMEYTSVFGSGTTDLSDLNPKIQTVEVNAIFGGAMVSLPDSIDFDIESNAVFGSVVTPDKTDGGLSSSHHRMGSGSRRVRVEANAIFGKVEFGIKHVDTPPVEPEPVINPDTEAEENSF